MIVLCAEIVSMRQFELKVTSKDYDEEKLNGVAIRSNSIAERIRRNCHTIWFDEGIIDSTCLTGDPP